MRLIQLQLPGFMGGMTDRQFPTPIRDYIRRRGTMHQQL